MRLVETCRGPGSITRPWTAADGQWYVDQLAETEMQRFTTESVGTTVEDFADALTRLALAEDQYGRAIVDPGSGKLAGNLAATREGDVAFVAYWVAEPMRGRRLARRAVAECCAWIEQNWPSLKRIQLSIHVENEASVSVALATGFRREPAGDKVISVRGDDRLMRAFVRPLRNFGT